MTVSGRVRDLLDRFRRPERPVLLVSGMPKAGTTALAMLLGEASGRTVVSDPFHKLDTRGVRFRDALYGGELPLMTLVRRHRRIFAGGVLKDPNFIFLADQVLEFYPDLPFVYIVRDPRANIRSILNRLKLPGRPAEAPAEPEVSEAWRRVLEGRTPETEGADYLERLAHRWLMAAHAYREHEDRMHLVRYEDFNADKPGTVERALRASGVTGGRPIEHLMDRQFQPRGNRGVSWEEFFGGEGLGRIEAICGEAMGALGYDPAPR